MENKFEARDLAAKAQYGAGVRRVMVEGHEDDEQVVAYVKFPDIATAAQAIQLLEKDPVAASDQLFNKCVIRELTDEVIFSDNELRWAVMQALPGLLLKKKGTLVRI